MFELAEERISKLKHRINRNCTILKTERKEWGVNRHLQNTIKHTNVCANEGTRGDEREKGIDYFLKK